MASDLWKIYAVRYAHHERTARENFIVGDPHDLSPMPLDYYVWGLVSDDRIIVVDTGFDQPMATKRARTLLKPLSEGLRGVGIEPSTVKDVLITHMHYDHCGNHDMFPAARYHVQDREMKFATGRLMTHAIMRFPFDEEDVVAMVRRVFRDRVVFHDGDEEIAPGVSVHHVGGHTMGMQIVRVHTRRGIVVLASDASHLYANMDREVPFPIVYNVGEMLEGYRRARSLATSNDHIIPGHDPQVMSRYPAASPNLEGWDARLD